ncbi:hypothetical protein INT45_009147 [Circinella minor]|uniref:Uncharacterized protein n=1 Tax=Circinella minor TaxID=1195481 RepID=A0A8H7SFD3_9FUNG|nr:hypothetical protein INT45_009147 [Circinella minor]
MSGVITTITSSSTSTPPITPVTSSEVDKIFFASSIDRRYSIQDSHGTILASTSEYLTSALIEQWLQHCPTASATLTLDGGDTIDLPVYALRRRNAVVANLPDSPIHRAT